MKIYVGKDKRSRISIKDEHGKYHVKSYPRILMEEKLGRPLEPYEDVHHIDGNPSNNSLDNLEIKLHGEHQREHSQKYFDKTVTCAWCGTEFLWTAKKQKIFFMNLSRKQQRNISPPSQVPFCSKSCCGKYGRQEQLKRNL